MQFIESEYNETLEVKKSKFITHITSYDKFHQMMQTLRVEHPKARHFVYAYRYLNEFNQIVENSSDDGEPKGTSGKPSLSVLAGANIINTGVIIVRYFGGIRLGTGGLVKAYSDAVNLVLKCSELKNYVKLKSKKLYLEYPQLSQIEYLLSQHEINVVDKEFTDKICLKLEASEEEYTEFAKKLFRDNYLED